MRPKIRASLKIIFSLFLCILIPAYWVYYGPGNFLWFSDITLFLTFLAIITEKPIFSSMAIVGGILLETFWIIDFLCAIFFDVKLTGLTDYMFDQNLPIWLRSLSLFHVVLPPLLVWLTLKLGYVRKAFIYQILLTSIVIVLTWLTTNPSENINWVFGYQKLQWQPLPFLILEILGASIVIVITHFLLLLIPKIRRYDVGE